MLYATVVGIIGVFLPWVNAPIIGTISGTAGSDGMVTLVLFGVTAVLLMWKNKKEILNTKEIIGIFICSGAPGLLALWKIIELNMPQSVDENNPFAKLWNLKVSVGIGLYIVALAGIAIVYLGIKMLKSKKAQK